MKFLTRWLSDAQLARPSRPARHRLLNVEHLEDRTVPAVTIADAAGVQGPVQSGNPSTFAAGYDPQALANPIRDSQIVAVYTTGTTLEFQVSDDFGTNWYGRSAGVVMRGDPLAYNGVNLNLLTNIDSPSIAFDRSDRFYVAYIQRNAANTAGVLMVEKYALVQDSLTGRWNIRNLNQTHVLYRWTNQDPVFNPSVAVNADPPTYTDPVTGAVQSNPTANRGVVVAWNTNATQTAFPGNSTFNTTNTLLTPATVWAALSDDGGVTFSTPQPVSDRGHSFGANTGMNPTVFFTPSTAGQTAGAGGTGGGQLGFLYSSGGSIVRDVTDPFAGRSVANPLTVNRQFTYTDNNNNIRGANPAADPLPARSETTDFTLNVDLATTSAATGFDFLADLNVTLSVFAQDLSLLQIDLIAPNNLGTVTILNNRQGLDNTGTLVTVPVRFDGSQAGVAGGTPSALGVAVYDTGDPLFPYREDFGLTFDDEAARYVNDPANVFTQFILSVKPEDSAGGFSRWYSRSAAELSGTWTLRVTNHKETDTALRGGELMRWEMDFVARVDTNGFGNDGGTNAPTSTTTAGLTGTPTPALAAAGLQGWYSVAADNSKGSFSPYQGRLYLASSDGTDIFVTRSDNGGTTWSAAVRVNDDANDGFSGGNRAKFQPTVAVDQTTGTVAVMWYDARWDASNARPATFVATSVDGGATWSPNTFLNTVKTALDAIDLSEVKIEPVPNNLASLASIGNGQALVVRDGVAVPLWTGNVNDGVASLMSAAVRVGAGARIVQGDMGPVSDTFVPPGLNGVSYNDSYTIDGTRQLDAFYVKFDRPVDPTTFTAADVRLLYRDTTGAAAQDISGQVLSVQALDRTGARSYNSAAPTSGTTATSSIAVPLPAGLANTIQAITVRVSLSGGIASDLTLSLVAPDGTVVQLSNGRGGSAAVATTFASATFSDVGTPIGVAPSPFGTVRGEQFLLGVTGRLTGRAAGGTWTLRAVNGAGQAVVISNWTLNLTTLDYGASRYLVHLAPQSRVGTYSYAVRGDIGDRVREVYTTSAQPTDQFPPTIANSNTAFISTINVTNQAPVAIGTFTVTVDMSNFGGGGGGGGGGNNMDADNLILRLKGPDGTIATLARQNGFDPTFGADNRAGTVYALTTFDDQAPQSVTTAGIPFTNVRPIDPLMAAFGGLTDINGTWTLEAINVTNGQRTRLDTWRFAVNGTSYSRAGAAQQISATPRATSDVIVSGFAAGTTLSTVRVRVDFTDPALNAANASDLLLRLRGPDPRNENINGVSFGTTTITLAYANGLGDGTAGAVFAGDFPGFDTTTFDSAAAQAITAATAPYGSVRPLTNLLTTFGGDPYTNANGPNGTWRLEVYNMATGVSSALQMDTWSLTLNASTFQPGFPVDLPAGASFGQSITVANEPPISLSNVSVSAEFLDPTGGGAAAEDNEIQLTLTGPDGAGGTTTINLLNATGGGVLSAGTVYRFVVFQDGGGVPAAGGVVGAASVVNPVDSLMAAFGGLTDINGTWTIEATNLSTGESVRFNNWQIVFQGTKAAGNKLDQNGNGAENEGGEIAGGASAESTIVASGRPNPVGTTGRTEVTVKFADPLATPANAGDVRLTLTGPNGRTVVLTDGTGTGTAGTAFGNVVFTDTPTGSGQVAPVGSLNSTTTGFGGLNSVNGAWTLTAVNLSTGRVLRLDSWSVTYSGNKVGDSAQDQFANPTPVGGLPFVLPYSVDSLPLVIPGPRLVSSTPNTAFDNTVSYIDVVFDKDMQASSFSKEQVIELRLPTGGTLVGGVDATNPPGTPPNPFTVTANPPGTAPLYANRTFRVSFPTQSIGGSYSLVLGSGIRSTSGLLMDPNMNAGVELVTGRVTDPNVAGTVLNEYNTSDLNLTVPAAASATAPGVLSSTFTLNDSFVITQLLTTPIKLRLDVTAVDARNLAAQLVAPDGTVVQLFTYVGDVGIGPFADFTGTEFSDFAAAGNLIQNAAAPFTGTFLPQQPLTLLNGRSVAGNWTLRLINKSQTDTATLVRWGLSLPRPVVGSGLGEPVVDRTTVGFRIFTSSPSQVQSTTQWTPVGPTTSTGRTVSGGGNVTTTTTNGTVTVTAVDLSDPSGNTVYAGAANGGLWKTTNFLTPDAAGPVWIPLLDAASAKAMHVTSITILPQNNAGTQQSVILVGTGDADTRVPGVGFLRSTDGGRTFRLIDSTFNGTQANVLPVDDPARDHLFSNPNNPTYVYKVVVDPVRSGGNYIVYAAVGGSAATQGLWRSLDSGLSWTRLRGGADCTDFVLAANRVDVENGSPARRVADIAYAAFAGQGVFFSDQISVANGLVPLPGGVGKPLFSDGVSTLTVGNGGVNPGGADRILLAVPPAPAGNDPLTTRIYQGWLYALVAGGAAPALYMTKDFGQNWTRVDVAYLTNDETQADFNYSVTQPVGLPVYNAMAADPTDPNVVYIGGNNVVRTADGTQVSGASGIYRVDVSTLSDAHAQVGGDNSKGGVGAQTEAASVGGIAGPFVPPPGSPPGPPPPPPTRVLLDSAGVPANDSAYFNRLRDPNEPFVTGATQIIMGSQFTNTGENAQLSQFFNASADELIRNIETVFDPLTRKTRLLISTARGVHTSVDGGNPLPTQGIYSNARRVTALGSATVVSGNRSSNLTLTDITQTGVQPSLLAADLAGLYNRQLRNPQTNNPLPTAQQNSVPGQWLYTVSEDAYLNAPGGLLTPGSSQYGATNWTGEVGTTPYLSYAGTTVELDYAGYVQTDPRGSGTIYQYRPPAFAATAGGTVVNLTGDSTDIFLVTLPGQRPIGRSNGLFQAGDSATTGQWASTRAAIFAVNQADPNGLIISSPGTGQVFLTTDQGINWFAKGTPGTFGNSRGTALAFGGRDPAQANSANTFFYNGTAAGRVFVTTDGGSSWREISNGLPQNGPILKLIPNPRANTFDAYLVTATGVFYTSDTRAAGFTSWTNVTGNLFSVSKPVFGESVASPILTELTAIQVDWRFVTPVLYAGGDSGVFKSTDGGGTWELYPANLGTASQADDGGYLPNARVTDLDLVYGELNSSGLPVQSGGRNVLVASTLGRGLFAIRLDTTPPSGQGTTGPWVNTAPLVQPNAVTGVATITLNFGDAAGPVRVDVSTLAANTTLLGPGNAAIPYTVTDISTVTNGVSVSNAFRLTFTPPSSGTYTLTLTTGVRDLSGRPMNQDRDATNGENPADFFIRSYGVTVNQAPTITAVANAGLLVGGGTATRPFAVGDAETPAASLVVTAASSNPAVVPPANITLGGTGAARTVTVAPGTAVGTSVITLTVTDGSNRQTSTTFTVSVATAPSVPFADNFDRPDAGDLGGSWVIHGGSVAGSFDSVLGTSPSAALATVTGLSQTDSASQATVALTSSGTGTAGLVARYVGPVSAPTAYLALMALEGGVVTARLYRQGGGASVELARSAALPVAAQYVLRFEVVNDSLKAFVNGALVAFAFDTAITAAGQTGIRLTSGNRIDDFATDNIVLAAPVPLPAVGTTTTPDTFTQPDGSQLTRDWRDRVGNLSVTGSQSVGAAAGANLSTYNRAQPAANEGAEVTVTVAAAGQSAGVVLRYTGTPGAADTNYYLGVISRVGTQSVAQLYRSVNGALALLTSANVTGTTGVLRFEANGPSLKLFFNGARVLTAYDTALAAGAVGIRTNLGGRADAFAAFALGTNAALPFADPFAASPPRNQLASEWTERAGAFAVTATGLAQGTATGASVATLNGVSPANAALTAAPRFTAAGQVFGLVARYAGTGGTGDTNFYFADIVTQANGDALVRIMRDVNGTKTALASGTAVGYFNPANFAAATPALRFEVFGSSLRVYLDNALQAFAVDTTFAAGGVGIRAGQNAAADSFDAAVRSPVSTALPYTDAFPSGANPQNSLATNWQERTGAFSVAANRATGLSASVPNMATLNGVNAANATIDGTFFFTAAGQSAGLVGRYTGGTGGTGDTNFYFADIVTQANGDALIRIRKDVGGVKTTLAQTTLAAFFNPADFTARNPVFRFVLAGSTLTVFVDGIQRLTTTDGSLTTGSVGIRTGQGAGIDNFSAS